MRLNNQSIIDLNYSINQGLKFAIGFKNNIEINNYTFINISKNSIILNITYSLYPYTNASAIYSDNGVKYYLGNIGNRSVNISLSCTDCLNITYCVDNVGTCTPNIIYSKSFNYSTLGYNFLRFRSNNSLGILEETKTEIIYLDPNAPTTSPIVWPECNPAEPCCNSNGYFRTSGFVCKSAYDTVCINASNCTGQAYEDRCPGTSSACLNTNNLINYPESCDDLVCLNQSCSGSTFQPERICSKEICQTNSPYSCQNNLNCQDSTNCKKQVLSSSDCKTGFLFDSNLKVCYLSNNYTYNLLYDANGNLISIFGNETGLGWTYLYNAFNQLSTVKDEGIITLANYTYDAFGRRIKKIEYDSCFNTNTYYLGNFIQKINSSGIFNETYYYFNGLLVGKKDNAGKIFFYHPNHLGSTTLITNSSGGVVEDLLYKPFGFQNDTSERYTYTGHEQDNEAGGIVYAGARYYNPELGLFLQADPVIGDIYNPQDLNKYAYARNNPYKYVDKEGNFPWPAILIGGGIGFISGSIDYLTDYSINNFNFKYYFGYSGGGFISGSMSIISDILAARAFETGPGGVRLITSFGGGVSQSTGQIFKNSLTGQTLNKNLGESFSIGAATSGISTFFPKVYYHRLTSVPKVFSTITGEKILIQGMWGDITSKFLEYSWNLIKSTSLYNSASNYITKKFNIPSKRNSYSYTQSEYSYSPIYLQSTREVNIEKNELLGGYCATHSSLKCFN